MLQTIVAFLLFAVEWFHIWGHSLIMFRIRLLPRKDLVRIRLYFFVDTLSVFISSIIFTGKLRWLAVLQILQHLYYFLCWDKTYPAKKIITWSSLDWLKSDLRNRWEIDSILGTMFDTVVHICMVYYLAPYLSTVQILAALVLVQAVVMVLLFGPYYAWASPRNIPPWIQKRIHPEKVSQS